MTTVTSRVVLGRVSWWRSARALIQLSVVRTLTPVLLITMIGLILLPMVFALVFASRGLLSGDPVPFLVERYDQLVSAFATPIIALLLATSAFSAEADDGTLLYVVTTTTPRWWIVFVRVCFAMIGTALASAIAVFGTGWIATGAHDPEHVTRAFGIARGVWRRGLRVAVYAARIDDPTGARERLVVCGVLGRRVEFDIPGAALRQRAAVDAGRCQCAHGCHRAAAHRWSVTDCVVDWRVADCGARGSGRCAAIGRAPH